MEHTVFVTGGSRGIGAATVRLFRAEGHRVAFLYEKSEQAARALAAQTGALALQGDVADKAQLYAAFDQAQKQMGPATVLINNAGTAQFSMFQDISEFDWRRMLDVHLTSAFFACQRVLPHMISRRHGVILNVSSMWGQVGASCEVHYSAAKAGLIGLSRALAKEVGPSGVRVNCVAPGAIETDMIQGLSQRDRRALTDETPLQRLGTPEDVAHALLFLASDAASFITGQVFGVNGGMVI